MAGLLTLRRTARRCVEGPQWADFVQTRLADYLILVGLGPARVPVDWHWQVGRGAVFSHAGTDLWGAGLEHGLGPVLTERCIAWATGETQCA